MDCKNCKYTDEYCASGECTSQRPRNHLATTSQVSDLTEQWKKGEFVICNAGKCQYYYVQNEKQQEVIKTEYCLFDDNTPNWQILAPVPSYSEWKDTIEKYHLCIEANQSLRKRLDEEMCKNKISYYDGSPIDYLDECERARRKNKMLERWIKNLREGIIKSGLSETTEGNRFAVELLDKIDEVLK